MRIGRRFPISGELSLVALALTLAGCSTSGQEQFSTASLAPRPEEGMRRDAPRTYTAETESPRPYTQPAYTPPPPQQRTATYAPYGQQQQPSPYSRPYGYGTQTAAGYGAPQPSAPYGYGSTPFRPAPYGQQQPYAASNMQTASVGAQPPMGQPMQQPMQPPMNTQQMPPAQAPAAYAPLTTGSLPRQTTMPLSNQGIYMVREGDTLFGISKRTGVPVQDLVAANKIQNNKISIGQQLKIPQKHAAR